MTETRRRCSVDGCGSGVLAKGLCSKHYERMRHHGSTDLLRKTKDDLCVECAERFAMYKSDDGGLCRRCYRRKRNAAQPRQVGICTNCKKEFFPRRQFTESSGRGVFCSTDCKNEYRVTSGKMAEAQRRHYYKKHYGLTLEQAEHLRSSGCAICASEGTSGRWGTLNIDHAHDSGEVRGALCQTCNLLLGYAQDDPELLRRAAEYIENPPGIPV